MFEIVVLLLVTVALVCLQPWVGMLVVWGVAALMSLVFGISRSMTPRRFKFVLALWSAPVIGVMVVAMVISPIAYQMGYAKGARQVKQHINDGSIHRFAQRAAGSGYSLGYGLFATVGPHFNHYCGYKTALRNGIPEHSGDQKHAREVLGKLGAEFVVTEDDRVVAISLTGPDVADANVHWVAALSPLHAVKIKAPSVTNASVKYFSHIRGLSVLILQETSITDDAIAGLRETHSGTSIRTSGSFGGSDWYRRGWRQVNRSETSTRQGQSSQRQPSN